MKFFKEYSYDIVKIYVTQIAISIFALMMYTAVGQLSADKSIINTIAIIISIFSTVFYIFLLYTSAWDWGAKDKIRADAGKVILDKAKAFKMSMIANIPNFILGGLAVISFAFCLGGVTSVFPGIGSTTLTIARFTASMYQSTIFQGLQFLYNSSEGDPNYIFYLVESCGYLFFFFLSIFATHLAYTLGSKEKKIFSFIKSNKKYE